MALPQLNILPKLLEKFPGLEKLTPEQLLERFEGLGERDQKIVLATTLLIIGVTLFFIFSTTSKRVTRLEKQLKTDSEVLGKIKAITSQKADRSGRGKNLQSRIRPARGFSLAGKVENEAQRFGIPPEGLTISRENRLSLDETHEEVSVDVKISQIDFRSMLDLMIDLESSKDALFRIHRLIIKVPPSDPVNVELRFKLATYLRK